VFSEGSLPRRAQSEDGTQYRTIVEENWVEFCRRQSKVIEKKWQGTRLCQEDFICKLK
jgi:hypothetical protein